MTAQVFIPKDTTAVALGADALGRADRVGGGLERLAHAADEAGPLALHATLPTQSPHRAQRRVLLDP